MKLKELLAAKMKKLADLNAELKSENCSQESRDRATALIAEIEALKTQIAQAEKAEALLKNIGTNEKPEQEGKKSELEIFAQKAKEITDKKTGVSMHFEKAYNTVVTSPTIAEVDRSIAPQPSRRAVADNFIVANVSGNAVTYFTQGAFETNSGIGTTAQNNKKPQASTSFAGTTLALSKIAAWIKETDEILYDAPFLASEVQNSLVYQIGKAEDAFIVNAIGNTQGIGAETYDGTTVTLADGILKAILKVKADSAFDAGVVILNPADLQTLLIAKDQNKQYYGGGYFVGAYGNGAAGIPTAIWGVPVITSGEVDQGTALVCAREAVKIWRKGGIDVRIYEQNEDDALYNRVTLLAENRLAAAVVDLKGVVLLATEGSGS